MASSDMIHDLHSLPHDSSLKKMVMLGCCTTQVVIGVGMERDFVDTIPQLASWEGDVS